MDQTRPMLEGVLNEGYVNIMRYKLPDVVTHRGVLQMVYCECVAIVNYGFVSVSYLLY